MRSKALSRRQKRLLDDALALTRRGYRVIPVAGDKTPLVKGYFGDKPYRLSVIRKQPWHKARYVGIVLRQDEIALDVDVKQAKCGEEHMTVCEGAYGPLPATMQQRTLTGGRHLLFRSGNAPKDARWRSKVALPDGGDADIDIVHAGYRFLVVYDLSVWLSADPEWPQIPDGWLVALLKPAGGKSARDQGPDACRRPVPGLDGLVDEVRGAKETDRNNTLNRWLFRATVDGHVGSDVEEQFRIAAEAAGLTPTEVDTTISSSVSAGVAARSHVDRWYMSALNHPDLQAPRTRGAYLAVITAVRDVALISPQDPSFGLSVRDLAERAGLSKGTASRYLNLLDANDLLQLPPWHKHHLARRYRLKFPPGYAQKRDSHPSLSSTTGFISSVNRTGTSSGDDKCFHLVGMLTVCNSSQPRNMEQFTLQLGAHSAFYRSVGHPSFPRSCASMLAALEMGYTTRKALLASTGLHRNTIRENLTRLEDAQILIKASDGSFHLVCDTAWEGLDRWARDHGIPDRIETQRAKHAEERDAYRKHLESGTTSKPRRGRKKETTQVFRPQKAP